MSMLGQRIADKEKQALTKREENARKRKAAKMRRPPARPGPGPANPHDHGWRELGQQSHEITGQGTPADVYGSPQQPHASSDPTVQDPDAITRPEKQPFIGTFAKVWNALVRAAAQSGGVGN
jgi:hypothetical protein